MPYTKLSDYNYDLPKHLIAQEPKEPRDSSRLMIVNRKTNQIEHTRFDEIETFFKKGDRLVLNNTKVIPARVFGFRQSGGRVELFFLKNCANQIWEVLAKPARKLPKGSRVEIAPSFSVEVKEDLEEGRKIVQVNSDLPVLEALHKYGTVPLPPYINRKVKEKDTEQYQTIFAEKEGALAAPTAGLHFTPHLLEKLKVKGVQLAPITLHVGMGTFKPVQTADIRDHQMHKEWCEILPKTAEHLNERGNSSWQLSVGTTSCRALESVTQQNGYIQSGTFETSLFIYPGYQFRATQALLTNFHLPQSSLLMLVSAFSGYELMQEAYRQAIQEEYRFFSYGDAMLIL